MLSKLQKISKGLILYSVLISGFEKLDFKNDALAGVRANFFNAKCSPQVDKTELSINSQPHALSYSLKKGEPLSWKITYGNMPVQTVKRSSDGGYCVISYSNSGVVFKRQYFSAEHIWLRTEYYDFEIENHISAVVFPKKEDGLVLLRLQRFTSQGIITSDLYPSLTMPKHKCTALIYSNSGMIWYDERFKDNSITQQSEYEEEKPVKGFALTREAFISENSSDVLNLAESAYLSEEDIPGSQDFAAEAPEPQAQPSEYSAYDKIESILFEAHKTNKNIFGELANHSFETDEADKPEITEEIAETEEKPEAEPETKAEKQEDNNAEPAAPLEPEINNAEQEEPDSVITTKQGVYTYFGGLDEEGKRSGRGRTVTSDGITAYDGEYSADKRQGFGICYYKDGAPNYVGDWADGNRSGRGVGYRHSDGTIHVGTWNSNTPEGFGARFNKEGAFMDVCTYVNGIRNGKSVSFDEDGNVIIRLWKDGEVVSERIIAD